MNALVEAARGGSVRAASRLISCIEDDPSRACSLLAEFKDCSAPRLVAGVTGAPGTGKSQLISALIREWRRREPEKRLGVLAVDPSSPRCGGAVLGDRIRMMEHATDDHVFIRSLANRGRLGGLTLGIRGSLHAMGLVGCDVVLLETVGVGQNEIEVAQVADLVAVVLAPGLGDAVQLLKSGLLEIADIVVVNKADRPGADRLFAELNAMLSLSSAARRQTKTFLVSAIENRGIEELVEGIEQIAAARAAQRSSRRAESLRNEAVGAVRESAIRMFDRAIQEGALSEEAIQILMSGAGSVEQAAAALMEAVVRRMRPQGAMPADNGIADNHDGPSETLTRPRLAPRSAVDIRPAMETIHDARTNPRPG